MQIRTLEFGVCTEAADTVLSNLREDLSLQGTAKEQLEITLLDSVDWRIFQQGAVLEARHRDIGSAIHLGWRKLQSQLSWPTAQVDGPIDFTWNLPAGELRDLLTPLLKKRILLPQVRLRLRRQIFTRRNRNAKAVLYLWFDAYQVFHEPSGRFIDLTKRIRLIPVKGYPKPFRQAVKQLSKDRRLKLAEGNAQADGLPDILTVALAALHKSPTAGPAGEPVKLASNQRTDQATKALLRTFLPTVVGNEAGLREDLDSEFLHDYRIAVRKTRSVLKRVRKIFPKRQLERYLKGFAWLGSLTGPVRDLDVHLLKLPEYGNLLPPDLTRHLLPLRQLIEQQKVAARRLLLTGLDSPRYRRLLKDYAMFLHTPGADHSSLANARRPLAEVAREELWRAYRRVVKHGAAIGDDASVGKLHDLRKKCKTLRYLLESFRPLYADAEVKRLIEELKKLQDHLGEVNDLRMQIGMLREVVGELAERDPVSAETGPVLAGLLDLLVLRQQDRQSSFSDWFSDFNREENRTLFRRTLWRGQRH